MHTSNHRARHEVNRTTIVERTVTELVELDPAKVLNQLGGIEPKGWDQNPQLRKMIHCLETLNELGSEFLPTGGK